jgi:hypothetical protein
MLGKEGRNAITGARAGIENDEFGDTGPEWTPRVIAITGPFAEVSVRMRSP